MLDPGNNAKPGHGNGPALSVDDADKTSHRPAPGDQGYLFEDDEFAEAVEPSLTDDIAALYDDGKTYLEAEIAFQKTRAHYAAHQSKRIVAYLFGAVALIHLALLALVVGLVIALEPYLTIWGSIAVVTGLLVVGAGILAAKLRKRLNGISRAFADFRDD